MQSDRSPTQHRRQTLTRAAREFYDPIIDQLIAIRKQQGLSQVELDDRIGCAERYVSKWEARMKYPSSSFLVLWAQALGVTLKIEDHHASDKVGG